MIQQEKIFKWCRSTEAILQNTNLLNFNRLTFFFHAITIPLLLVCYIYYFKPHQIDYGSLYAALLSCILVGLNVGFLRKFSFDFYHIYTTKLFKYRRISIPLQIVVAVVVGVWFVWIIDSLSKRIEYLQIIRTASKTFQEGSIAVPDPVELGRAFALFPKRTEVPFLTSLASRVLIFSDSQVYFNSFMKKFVQSVGKNYEEYELNVSKGGGEIARVYFAQSMVQSNYTQEGLRKALAYILGTSSNTLYEKMFIELLNIEMLNFHSYILKGTAPKDVPDKVVVELVEIIKKFQKIIDDLESIKHAQSLQYSSSHVFQEVLDKIASAHIYKSYLAENATDVDKLNSEAIRNYARVLDVRSRLAQPDLARWYTPPSVLNIHSFFEARRGAPNYVSGVWLKILQGANSNIVDLLDQKILKTEHFSRFRKADYWHYGTPIGIQSRGHLIGDHIIKSLKSGW